MLNILPFNECFPEPLWYQLKIFSPYQFETWFQTSTFTGQGRNFVTRILNEVGIIYEARSMRNISFSSWMWRMHRCCNNL